MRQRIKQSSLGLGPTGGRKSIWRHHKLGHKQNDNPQTSGGVETLPALDTPKMYAVLLLNDDYTPMDFVVSVLRRFFAKDEAEATRVMLDVHKKGSGVAGIFTLEVAEMKVMQVNQYARMNEHPLKSALEEA